MRNTKLLPQLAAIFTAIIVLIYILKVPIGLADGGGQYKLLESLGLSYITNPTPDYFATQYKIYKGAQVIDTHSAIVSLAIGGKENIFNVGTIAFLYGILFIIGLFLVINSGIRNDVINWVLAALCVLVFADIGYTAYFNTLYNEGAILTTFLIAVGLILLCHKKKTVPIYLVILAVIFSLAFAFCGTLQAWIGVVLGIVIARISTICNRKLCKAVSIGGGLAVVIMSIVFALTYKPVDYEKNIFHSVFLGTAKHEGVEELGLSPKLNELEGQFYSEALAEQYNLRDEFYNKINYAKITKFYLTHPTAFIKEINGAVKNAYTIRPSYLGNYTQVREDKLAGGFSLYSTFKSKFIPNTIVFTLIFFVIYLGMLIYIYITEREKRSIIEVLIAFGLSAVTCLKLPLILTGGYEIGRALFTFNIMFDAMIISVIVAGGRFMIERRKNLQNKYGTNQ